MKKETVVYKTKLNKNSVFIGNTFAILIKDYRPEANIGLFFGTKMCLDSGYAYKYGQIYTKLETCSFDEFEEEPLDREKMIWQ